MSLWAVLIQGALAGGYEVAQQGVRAGGMGHAGTTSTNSESAWFNPAALADGVPRAGVGAVLAAPRIETTLDGVSTQSVGGPSLIPQLHASYVWNDWAAGASVNAPFGGGVEWPVDWDGRYDIVCSRTQVVRVAPFVAHQRGPVSLSVGPHLDFGTLEVFKATDHVSEEGSAHLGLNGRGVGVHVSALMSWGELDLGLAYKSRTSMRLEGVADFDVPDPFAATLPDQGVGADWTLPDRLALGVGWRGVHVDLVSTMWSLNEELVFELEESDDVVNTYDWRTGLALRVGGEATLEHLEVRGGLAFERTPVPVQTLGPSSPDGPRFSMTAGAGRELSDSARADAFVEHLRILERQSSTTQASFGGSAWVVGVGLQVRRP